MAMGKRSSESFIAFDVIYEDGSRSSNRRVPSMALSGMDGDLPARSVIEEQDRAISEASGRPRPAIKSVMRSGR